MEQAEMISEMISKYSRIRTKLLSNALTTLKELDGQQAIEFIAGVETMSDCLRSFISDLKEIRNINDKKAN